jgi:hypothetical protein
MKEMIERKRQAALALRAKVSHTPTCVSPYRQPSLVGGSFESNLNIGVRFTGNLNHVWIMLCR